ncbi:MAG: F0F1 ATP synthase subunit gamma, partial [Nitratireductor sp.]|nr:F0F1 ATP synthase subunit gamma [Nitratireductor sp.]
LRRDYSKQIVERIDLREAKVIQFHHADAIGKKIIGMFDAGEFDVCTLFFSRFKSVISQIPTASQLIPADAGEVGEGSNAAYEYEPDVGSILGDLIPRNISVQIFSALLENVAGEMGAKMSAMDNATRNAGEMINKLTLTYNRQRQAQITKELIEIISGAEAL